MAPVVQDAVIQLGSIAEGAFGEVSIARTPQFREVAIKWLKASETPLKREAHGASYWQSTACSWCAEHEMTVSRST